MQKPDRKQLKIIFGKFEKVVELAHEGKSDKQISEIVDLPLHKVIAFRSEAIRKLPRNVNLEDTFKKSQIYNGKTELFSFRMGWIPSVEFKYVKEFKVFSVNNIRKQIIFEFR